MIKLLIYFCLSIYLCLDAHAWTVKEVPNPTDQHSYISNPDQVLTAAEMVPLRKRLAQIEASTTNEVSIVVLKSIGGQAPKTFANDLFNQWGIGKKGKDNGLLILLVMDQRRIEFEVGYGLEGTLTDLKSFWIIRNHMIPRMQAGDSSGALHAALSEIEKVFDSPISSAIQFSSSQVAENPENIFAVLSQYMDLQVVVPVGMLSLFGLIALSPIIRTFKANNKMGLVMLGSVVVLFTGLYLVVSFFKTDIRNQGLLLHALACVINLLYLLRQRPDQVANFIHSKVPTLPQSLAWNIVFFWSTLILTAWRIVMVLKKNILKPKDFDLLSEQEENLHLTPNQDFEEQIGSVEYVVYLHPATNTVKIHKNVLPFGKFKICDSCSTRAESVTRSYTVVSPTYSSSGTGERVIFCQFCKAERRERYVIPKMHKSSSSSSGSFGGGSRGGSFGGGRSGGGGAGGSW